jgi:glycosyltransferase involved in cell wall biosynthesis
MTEKTSKLPTVEIYTFAYNESLYIDYFVKWYSARFTNLKITILDNHSTDDTAEKAESLGCDVVPWGNPDSLSNWELAWLKNNYFKNRDSDYFIICDIDEFLDISENDLLKHQPAIVQGIGYDLVGDSETKFQDLHLGIPLHWLDKCFLFKRSEIVEINFGLGAHSCKPVFVEGREIKEYHRSNLYHFRWLSLEHVIERWARNAKRIPEDERSQGIAYHYFSSPEQIQEMYDDVRARAVPIPIKWEL